MTLSEIIEEAEGLAKRAMGIEPKKINKDSVFPNTRGIYLLYKNSHVIYIGQGKQLKNRLNQHLSPRENTKNSTLRRKLDSKLGIKPLKTRKWIIDKCRISLFEIEDSDMCSLVESLLIAHCRTVNPKLLNS
jgi:hypothetical protein